jgi:O-antigen ligase
MTPGLHSALSRRRSLEWSTIVLAIAPLALLPFGRTAEVPMLIMALFVFLVAVTKGRGWYRHPSVRLFIVVFLAMWIPILVSLPDAVNPPETERILLNHLRFLFAGLFIVQVMGQPGRQVQVLRIAAWILLFWLVDAHIQQIVGRDLFGSASYGDVLTGPFSERNVKFAFVYALLSPLLFTHARKAWPVWAQALIWLGSLNVVMSGGTRASWVAITVVALGFAVLYWRSRKTIPLRFLLAAVVLVPAIGVVAYHTSYSFQSRATQVATLLSGKLDPMQSSMAHRIVIWRTGLNMISHHPINGVGARGFRYAYPEFTLPDDPYIAAGHPIVPTHSHQLLVEVTAETGLVGLAGLATACVLLVLAARRGGSGKRDYLLPYGLSVLAILFPFTTHWALYSAHFSLLLWYMISMYFGAHAAGYADPGPAAGDSNTVERQTLATATDNRRP